MTNTRFGWHSGAVHCKSLSIAGKIDTGATEKHGFDIAVTGSTTSGGNFVGGNFAVTTAGTAATWVSGIYAKVTQGTTKNVSGYISGAEFEVVLGTLATGTISEWAVLVLNANDASTGSYRSYIWLRDYGSLAMNAFVRFSDNTVQTHDAVSLLCSTSDIAATHTIRILIGSTPYWILCSSGGPQA